MKGQSKKASLLEAILNTLIGFWIAVLANYFLLPLWGLAVSLTQSVEIGLLFTWIAILRGYILRRLFNYWHVSRECS
jgi:hypothetical protein